MTNANPLSCSNILLLRHSGTIRVAVSYRPSGQADPSEDREAAEHLLEIATECAKEIMEELNDVIDTTVSIDGISSHAETRYSAAVGLSINDAGVTVEITVHVPSLEIPIGQLIFRVHEALGGTLTCQWHAIDPEGYEKEVADDEGTDEELPLHQRFIRAVDENLDIGAN